uniref:NADAR domain-containing protein n=1 Tax=Panagrellus redivivus TaxID=6233 RepID=A0A7E4ZZB9_PANRE
MYFNAQHARQAHRNQRPVQSGRIQKQAPSHSVFYPFAVIPETEEQRPFIVNDRNFEFFHGFTSIFTLQYMCDIVIDGQTYRSVDHYYQKMKVFDMTGVADPKFDDPKTRNYSAAARECLRANGVSRKTVDEWRTSCGIEVVQKALLERVRQSGAFRSALLNTGDKIIVHCFAADDFFATGCPVNYIKNWANSMEKNGLTLTFPTSYPLTADTAKYVPTVAKGRNMLGAILMALREQVQRNNVDNLSVGLTPVKDVIKNLKKRTPPPVSEPPHLPPVPAAPTRIPVVGAGTIAQQPIQQAPPGQPKPLSTYSTGATPVMYSAEEQAQRAAAEAASSMHSLNNRYPETPMGIASVQQYNRTPATFSAVEKQPPKTGGNLEDLYSSYRQQQQIKPAEPTYGHLASQNQDFSEDVDGGFSSRPPTQSAIHPAQVPGNIQSGSSTTNGGQYEWNW